MKNIIISLLPAIIFLAFTQAGYAQLKNPAKDNQSYTWMKYFILAKKSDPDAFTRLKPIRISRTLKEQPGPENGPTAETNPSFNLVVKHWFGMASLSKYNHPNSRYSISYPQPSSLSQIAGMAAGILGSIFYPSYIGSIYHNSGATIEAYNSYLESTYHQHNQ